MKTSEIQTKILAETGLKTSAKLYKTGSMNGYIRIMPIFQNGSYPSLPFDFVQKLKIELAAFDYSNKPLLCTISDICVFQIEYDRILMKKESKTKPTRPLICHILEPGLFNNIKVKKNGTLSRMTI